MVSLRNTCSRWWKLSFVKLNEQRVAITPKLLPSEKRETELQPMLARGQVLQQVQRKVQCNMTAMIQV